MGRPRAGASKSPCYNRVKYSPLRGCLHMAQDNDVSRRDVLKAAGAVTVVAGAPFIQTVKAANQQVQYGMIGCGIRGTYLLKHLKQIASGHCVALCDLH